MPRQVTRLADYALLAGAAAGLETIDAAAVEAVDEELAWPMAPERRRISSAREHPAQRAVPGRGYCGAAIVDLEVVDSLAQHADLLLQRLAIDADALENLAARRLNRFGRLADFVEIAGPFFDFEDRFVDRFEIDLLSGRLPLGAEAQGAGGEDAAFRNTSLDGISASQTTTKSLP